MLLLKSLALAARTHSRVARVACFRAARALDPSSIFALGTLKLCLATAAVDGSTFLAGCLLPCARPIVIIRPLLPFLAAGLSASALASKATLMRITEITITTHMMKKHAKMLISTLSVSGVSMPHRRAWQVAVER